MKFPENFLWGAASASAQVEGAVAEDGRTPSIWNALEGGHVEWGDNSDVCDDHYHRYKEDVAIMKKLGLKSYRFSISWSRVISAPGQVNEKGLAFYSSLVDELIKNDIEPLVTLYHWDLPMWMYNMGGWDNTEIVSHFVFYTKAVVDALSDRVQYWMTINEPQIFVTLGYYLGVHAPFQKRSEVELKNISRNVMLAHGRAVQIIRKAAKKKPMIGFAPTGSGVTPLGDGPEDIEKARSLSYPAGDTIESYLFSTNYWCDPLVLGTIPEQLEDTLSKEDMEKICQPLDFFGFNVYNSRNYEPGPDNVPMVHVPGYPRTQVGWGITPECLYWMPKFHYERYHLPILITENGMSNADFIMDDGKVHDPQRETFVKRYLRELGRVIEDGVPVLGYQYWSIMDNFEWASGFTPRFGLIYVDYTTMERTIKESAYAYAEIIRTNGESL